MGKKEINTMPLAPENKLDQQLWDKLRKITDKTHNCNVEHMWIPMRDGVKLYSTLITPKKGNSWPVVVVRNPYLVNNLLYDILISGTFTKNGYAFILVDVRGTQKSEGEWLPLLNEREDGRDVIDWIGEQSWCNGNIGTYGQSYLGYTQWAVLDYDHPMLKTHFISVFGSDVHQMMWRRGMFRQEVSTMWAAQMMGENRFKLWMGGSAAEMYRNAYNVLPQAELGETLIGEPCEWYKDWATKPDPQDPYWSRGLFGDIRTFPKNVKSPIYLQGGWWDLFTRTMLETYRELPEDIRKQSCFLIGPWHHNCMTGGQLKYPNEGGFGVLGSKEAVKWFDHHLKGEPYDGEVGIMKAYCIGDNKYHDLKDDLPATKPIEFFFGENMLSTEKVKKMGSFIYTFDPEDPVESAGGNLIANNRNPNSMNPECSTEQDKVGARDDVISFVSPKLKKSMTIAGSMKVELYVSSDAPATAFTVKVCEVFGGPKGKAFNIRDDITDIRYIDEVKIKDYKPGTVRKLTFEMTDVYWKLQKGSAIRVDISSSNFPAYHVHSNTEVVFGEVTEKKIAHNTVFYGGKNATKIILPVVK